MFLDAHEITTTWNHRACDWSSLTLFQTKSHTLMWKRHEIAFKVCLPDLLNPWKSKWPMHQNKSEQACVFSLCTAGYSCCHGNYSEQVVYRHDELVRNMNPSIQHVKTKKKKYREVTMVRSVTYGGPVFSHKPQVVSEEWKNADAEHGRHKKEKQDMEFGVRLWQVTLREEGEREDIDQQWARHEQHVTPNRTGTVGPQG